MSLSDELDRLWGEVGRLGRPTTGYRNPGLGASQIRDRLGLDTPPEVLEWFAFCNGIEYADSQTQNDVALVPGYAPLPLDEAIAVRDENLDYEGPCSSSCVIEACSICDTVCHRKSFGCRVKSMKVVQKSYYWAAFCETNQMLASNS